MAAQPADGTAAILHLIEAARAVTKDYQSEIDPGDFRRLGRWVDELEKFIERAAPAEAPVGWEPRRWREVKPGDTVSAGGVEARVEAASTSRWHVDPQSNPVYPKPLEHDVTTVRLAGRDRVYQMPPDGEVETLRGPIGQEIDRQAGRGRADREAERIEVLGHWAGEAWQTLAAAGLQPEEVKW
jgi:hypothetical protein